ncbi:MAG: hypothetical protein AB1757_12115 [Acidobacteriota bacterium]
MYCPKCGHEQASEAMRFCSKCGLSLDGVSDLIETSDVRFQREKKEVRGIGMLIGTVMILLFYYLMFGALTLPKITDEDVFAGWFIGLSIALLLGSIGLYNLISSGFFRKFKERRIKIHLERLKKRERQLEARLKNKMIEEKPGLQMNDTAQISESSSITEATTRNLEENYRTPESLRNAQ